MEMPSSATRAKLAVAASAPEWIAASAMLAKSTPKNAVNAALRPHGTTRQCVSDAMPNSSPSAAKSKQRCGPELPNEIGSGGSSSAVAKKSVSQLVIPRQCVRAAAGANAQFLEVDFDGEVECGQRKPQQQRGEYIERCVGRRRALGNNSRIDNLETLAAVSGIAAGLCEAALDTRKRGLLGF